MIEQIYKKDEWTQEELYRLKEYYEPKGLKFYLVDTILKPLKGIDTITYNPFELKTFNKDKSVFVFYCDTGKSTKERLNFYKDKLQGFKCVSLYGGRGYWRPNFSLIGK